MATAVAKRESKVPALASTPALEITSDDIALNRVYLGQFMSGAVKEQLVKPGCIFTASSQDDPDPQVLWSPGDERGVQFHVLGLRKGKSISEGGELQLFDYDDPNAPEDAWVTYNYTICLPDVDDVLPFKLLLTRTGRAAALQINTVLKKNSISGPPWESAFELTAAPRENQKGKWFVARVKPVTPTKQQVEIAAALGEIAAAQPAPAPTTRGDEPAI